MTTAEKIALQFENDGQVFEVDDIHIADVCQDVAWYPPSVTSDSERYEFTDGSAIVVTGGGWDLGFPAPATCHCWPNANHGRHSDDCEC